MLDKIDPALLAHGHKLYAEGASPVDVISDLAAMSDDGEKSLAVALGYLGGLIGDIRAIRNDVAVLYERAEANDAQGEVKTPATAEELDAILNSTREGT